MSNTVWRGAPSPTPIADLARAATVHDSLATAAARRTDHRAAGDVRWHEAQASIARGAADIIRRMRRGY